MAEAYSVVSTTFNTSSGTTQDIVTGIGEPDAAIFIHAHTSALGTIAVDGGNSISFSDFSDSAQVGGRSEDGQVTTDCNRFKDTGIAACYMDESSLFPPSRATVSLNGDDIRLTWAASSAPSDSVGAVFCIEGVQAAVINKSFSLITDASDNVTGAGFAPNVAISVSATSAATSTLQLGDQAAGFGFAVKGGEQASACFYSRNAQATSSVQGYISDEWFLSLLSTSTARGMEVTDWLSDGIEVTARAAGFGWDETFLLLQLADDANAEVVHLDLPGSTGETTLPFSSKPNAVILVFNGISTFNSRTDADSGLVVSFITEDDQHCSAMIDEHGAGTSATHGVHTAKAIKVPSTSGGTLWEADFVEFNASGLKLDFTTVDTARKAIAIGFKTGITQSLSHSLGMLSYTGHQGLASSVLVMSQEVTPIVAIGETQNVVHSLGLTQEVDPGTFQNVAQNLGISQTVSPLVFGPVVQNLNLEHAAIYAGPIAASVSSTISMLHSVGRALEESVSQSLNLTHQAADVQEQNLNLTHSVFGYLNASPHFEHDLGISHTVQITAAYTAAIEHADVVTHSIAFWVDDGTSCPRSSYHGDQGTLGDEPFTADSKMTLVSIDGTDDLILLRNPEMDDRDRVGLTRINRESRGGELQVFRDPTWPLVNTLQATIVGLKKDDVDDYLGFLEDHLGEEISLNDWHGRYWRGVIINPDEPAVEDTPNRWTVLFEFEGVEMPGPDVFQSVGIGHTLGVIQELTRSLSHSLGLSHSVDPGLHNVHYESSSPNNVTYNGDEVFYG